MLEHEVRTTMKAIFAILVLISIFIPTVSRADEGPCKLKPKLIVCSSKDLENDGAVCEDKINKFLSTLGSQRELVGQPIYSPTVSDRVIVAIHYLACSNQPSASPAPKKK